jgi:ABC-type hemin transport system substrate-binding protein
MGGENVFASRERHYPLAADLGRAEAEPPGIRDTRYPRVTADEVLAAQPEMILLPDDPFHFTEGHKQTIQERFADTPAVRNKRVFFVDGSLLTWYGTRLAKAIQVLPSFFSPA